MARITDLLESVRNCVPVNGGIGAGTHAHVRHDAFIMRNLLAGVFALALVPLVLAANPGANLFGVLSLGVLSLLAPVGLYLSRSGNSEIAHLLQAAVIATFVTGITLSSGGIGSVAVLGFAVLPCEAALTGTRRVIVKTALIAGFCMAGIALAQMTGIYDPASFAHAVSVPAPLLATVLIAYGIALALEFERINCASESIVRERDYLFQIMAGNVLDAVSLHDRSGNVLFATRSIGDILQADSRDALDDGLFRRVHVADRPAYLKALTDAIADGEPTGVEFRARTGAIDARGGPANPSFVWLEMRCKPIEPVPGRSDRIVATTRDVTAKKDHEDELRRAREKAEEAYELKTRFLANISHELRTPLNAIIGFSDLLREQIYGPIGNDKYIEYAQLIHDSGDHLLSVVNDILDMSKIEAGKFQVLLEPFEPLPVIRECIDMTIPQAQESGVSVTHELGADLDRITADRRAVRQILINLLSNAIKFTDSGGVVTVSARRAGGRFLLSVSDTGIGVGPEDIERLGKPFFQADSAYSRQKEGTGLGLSVVKGLTELHGGELCVKSEIGVGTTVTIDLPDRASAEPVPLNGAAAATDGPTPGQGTDDTHRLTA